MRQKYPIGLEHFEKLREENYLYIDKTKLIYELFNSASYIFLARPRRFGKSLLLSTIKSIFEGRRDLFKGLWIDSSDYDWTPRPVFHLSFVQAKGGSIESLRATIDDCFQKWEEEYEIDTVAKNLGDRFYNLVKTACQVSGQRVAVLIDEYDKMLVNNLHNEELHDLIKEELKPIYGVLKRGDEFIHFGMVTGVSRFSRMSIFSDINNLRDISLLDQFGAICGLTEEEIRTSMRPGIEAFAEHEGIDFESMMSLLKKNYDGYHFSAKCPDIYNPFSLLNALAGQKLEHFWYATGTPTFLVKMMRHSDEDIRYILNADATSIDLASSDTLHRNLKAVLFQTGYLTIRDYDRDMQVYSLKIPNREVESGLFNSLLPEFSGKNPDSASDVIIRLKKAVRDGKPEVMMEVLKAFLADIPYDLSKNKPEVYFENNLYIIFKLLGFYAQTEYRTSRGRIDILTTTPRYVYIIELKLDGTAEEAMAQIADRDYAAPFAVDGRTVFRIGIGFSKTTRNIDSWKIES